MTKFDVAVVGGGAAGIVAAISTKRKGNSVVICEKMPTLGKKILASGNGRCNLLNENLKEDYYNAKARDFVKSIFSKFGKDHILRFFSELGLEVYSDSGRIFPATNQASSVLKALEIELKNLAIQIELNFDIVDIFRSKEGFVLISKSGKKIECDNIIVAGGGKTYPALGSDGNAYKLAGKFGHTIVEPVPSAVPLVVKDKLCHALQGQRISASARSIIGGKTTKEAAGELLFTKYGVSGTCILDISEDISIAINRFGKKDIMISVDMVPFMKKEVLSNEITKRISRKILPEDFLVGILPNKFGSALKDILNKRDIDTIIEVLKDRQFKVLGTRGWNEAEFTAGGIDTSEVNEHTLESKLKKGLYLAGEILDVSGRRGGYNLAWAWASGFISGLTE